MADDDDDSDPRAGLPLARALTAAVLLPIAVADAYPWLSALAYVIVALTLHTTRWALALLGLALIRGYVVHRTRRYREALGPAGRITDPHAPWRQWLDTRCPCCGA